MKFNVLMECGAGFRGVSQAPEDNKMPFRVFDSDGARRPIHENGDKANCLDCKCRRKAKRKQDKYYIKADKKLHRAPTGISICCHFTKIEKLT